MGTHWVYNGSQIFTLAHIGSAVDSGGQQEYDLQKYEKVYISLPRFTQTYKDLHGYTLDLQWSTMACI
jgi:hypothetical protein